MTAEQYDRDRIGSVLWFAQSHPWAALVAVVAVFSLLLAFSTRPGRRR